MSGEGARPKTTASGAAASAGPSDAQRQTPNAGQLSVENVQFMKYVVKELERFDKSDFNDWNKVGKVFIGSGDDTTLPQCWIRLGEIYDFLVKNPDYKPPDTPSDCVEKFKDIYIKVTPMKRSRYSDSISRIAIASQSGSSPEVSGSSEGSKVESIQDRPPHEYSSGIPNSESLPAMATSDNSGLDQPSQTSNIERENSSQVRMETNFQADNPVHLGAQERSQLNLMLNLGDREPIDSREIKNLKSMNDRLDSLENLIKDEFRTLRDTLHSHETVLEYIKKRFETPV